MLLMIEVINTKAAMLKAGTSRKGVVNLIRCDKIFNSHFYFFRQRIRNLFCQKISKVIPQLFWIFNQTKTVLYFSGIHLLQRPIHLLYNPLNILPIGQHIRNAFMLYRIIISIKSKFLRKRSNRVPVIKEKHIG